jgi:sterol desaturase/sphingolipid hydroxylase (fatty acid hydroxylase superfamily)
MIEPLTLRMLVISTLVAVVVTAAVVVGYLEWRRANHAALPKGVKVSLSTIPPNALMYWLMSPLWFYIYQSISDYAVIELSGFYRWMPLALLLCDFSYYVEHRIAHRIPLLWKLYHGTHHTGTEYNIPLAFRVNALNLWVAPLFYAPWLLLGLDPLLIVGFQLFVFHYQGWVHTELIGELKVDRWLNTPANHRMHHSCQHQANFGACLMIWDHMFETYMKPEHVREYGIKGFSGSESYAGIYLNLWKLQKQDRSEAESMLLSDNKK